MLEILLSDGKKYGMHELQCRFRDYGIERVLKPIGMGYDADGLPPNKLEDMETAEVIDALKREKLESHEQRFLEHLMRFREKLNSFDKERYGSFDPDVKAIHALRFGRECAQIMEEMMKGYRSSPGCVSIEHPMEYFTRLTNTPLVKDPGTGFLYPFGLKRTD